MPWFFHCHIHSRGRHWSVPDPVLPPRVPTSLIKKQKGFFFSFIILLFFFFCCDNFFFDDFSQLCIFLANSSCFSNRLFITEGNKRYFCLGKLLNIIKASLLTPQAVLGIPDTHFHWSIDGSVLPDLTFPWVPATKALIFLFIALIDLGKTGLFLSSALCNMAPLLFSFYLFWLDLPSFLLASHLMCLFTVKKLFPPVSGGFVLFLSQGVP